MFKTFITSSSRKKGHYLLLVVRGAGRGGQDTDLTFDFLHTKWLLSGLELASSHLTAHAFYHCTKQWPLTSSSHKSFNRTEGESLDEALKVVDLITPKTRIERWGSHLRLIKDCMHDLLEIGPKKFCKQTTKTECIDSKAATQDMSNGILDNNISWLWMNMVPKEHALFQFAESANASTLSGVLSSCGAARDLKRGIQFHSVAIKAGFDMYVYVGSSLISLYAKCGQLEDAFRVFEKMSVRNTVSWTAIIAGFAQHWQIETCLELFRRMRRCAMLRPNDFTFATLLSACTGSGSLGPGRSAHCLTFLMGFDSHLHVANALISMYSKCGSIEDALYVFKSIPGKDLISWNSMIAGYAQHGLAKQAINLLEEIENHNIKPDSITFLGVLSSCRHVGLIEQSRSCFDLMLKHKIEPELDHYSCIVDLLGRAGLLEEALEFIEKMPIHPNAVIWGSLLSSCRVHGNVWIGIRAAENRLLMEPNCAATHVQLANLYACAGYWNHAAKVRKLMKERGLKTSPGFSWIEIGHKVYRFRAEDRSNTRVDEIFAMADSLVGHMISLGYVPGINSGSNEGVHL